MPVYYDFFRLKVSKLGAVPKIAFMLYFFFCFPEGITGMNNAESDFFSPFCLYVKCNIKGEGLKECKAFFKILLGKILRPFYILIPMRIKDAVIIKMIPYAFGSFSQIL